MSYDACYILGLWYIFVKWRTAWYHHVNTISHNKVIHSGTIAVRNYIVHPLHEKVWGIIFSLSVKATKRFQWLNYGHIGCYGMHGKLRQSCLTLCDSMDCSLPGSPVHGILQVRILEWVAMPSSRGSSRPRNWTCVSYVTCTGRWVLLHWSHLGSPGCYGQNVNYLLPILESFMILLYFFLTNQYF